MSKRSSAQLVDPPAGAEPFSEASAWRVIGSGWQPLHGGFSETGFSIEWHDFRPKRDFNWAASFHPESLELCLNLAGRGFVACENDRIEIAPETAAFYFRAQHPILAGRSPGEQHQFLTAEFSISFLKQHLAGVESIVHPVVRQAMAGPSGGGQAGPVTRLTAAQLQLVGSLRQPPVYAAAQPLWYRCKALELALTFLVQPPPEEELFCTRYQRLADDRVSQVIFLLKQDLSAPPSLEEMGRKIGCSPFHLSRSFSAHTGGTIPQYLRRLRMERAAELLRTGEYNVTEVSLEVGYNSVSHFSVVFHETYGCCPGLYPLKTPAQRKP